MDTTVPSLIRPDERDAVLNAVAHALAVYEQAPSNWVRLGDTQIVQDILNRLAPPARKKCDTAQPMALRVARKHINALRKMKPAEGGEQS